MCYVSEPTKLETMLCDFIWPRGGMAHVYLHVALPMPRGLESQEIMHGTDPLSVTNQCRMSNIYWAECFGLRCCARPSGNGL